jgi:hypothetical protein
MQKTYGFAPLGAADGPVKTAIFGGNSQRLYNFEYKTAIDRFDTLKADYLAAGANRSNLRYGYVSA